MVGEIKKRILHFDWEVSFEEFSLEKKLGGVVIKNLFLFSWPNTPLSSFTIPLTHTTASRTPLDDGLARRTDHYLTGHNTHNRETFIPPAGFEPTTPGTERSRTHALDLVANWISIILCFNGKLSTAKVECGLLNCTVSTANGKQNGQQYDLRTGCV
jgi:hypothetical protein